MAAIALKLKVMIASPSDVTDDRDAVEQAIHDWNISHSDRRGVVLVPWRWETSAVPKLGATAQEVINSQGVDQADIIIAIFGSRLGTETASFDSGTVEEVERALRQEKPVHLYFSSAPLPSTVDTVQLEALREFKASMLNRGLLGEYATLTELNMEVWKALDHDIDQIGDGSNLTTGKQAREAKLLVNPKSERETKGFDKSGKAQISTRHWLEITNQGNVDAEEFEINTIGESTSMHLGNRGVPTVLHSGQTRNFPLIYTFGGGGEPIVRISWKVGDEKFSQDFHVG